MKKFLCLLLAAALVGCGSTQAASSAAPVPEEEPEEVPTLELARLYVNDGNYEQAILTYTALIEIDPKNVVLYEERADVYTTVQNYEAAVGDYTAAIGIDDTAVRYYVNRGSLSYYLGNTGDGERDLKKAAAMSAEMEDQTAVLTSLQEYLARLGLEKEDHEISEGASYSVYAMPDGSRLVLVLLDGSPYGVQTVPAGEEIPDYSGQNLLNLFHRWKAIGAVEGYSHELIFNGDGTVTESFGEESWDIPVYTSNGDGPYPPGVFYFGGDGTFLHDETEWAGGFTVYEGKTCLWLAGVHFGADELLAPVFEEEPQE